MGGGGLYSVGLIFFCLQADGPITSRGKVGGLTVLWCISSCLRFAAP